MKRIMTIIALSLLSIAAFAANKTYSVKSPDGSLVVNIETGSAITYSVIKAGTEIISPSEISMTLGDGTIYGGAQKTPKATSKHVDQTLTTVIYKKNEVKDIYNELTLSYKAFNLVVRVYDEGAAYRFVSKSKNDLIVKEEKATLNFAKDWETYIPYVREYSKAPGYEEQFFHSFENYYEHTALSQWQEDRIAFLPLLVEADNGYKVCVTESDLLNYPGMYLYNFKGGSSLEGVYPPYPKEELHGGHNNLQGIVKSREDFIAKVPAGEAFPWRIVIVEEQEYRLADNDMVYKLARPDDGRDWSWVKPGKVAWDWWNAWNIYGEDVDFKSGINNATYKYYIDFASQHGIEYVILDEGWAVNKAADLLQIVPEINLEELVAYADERNVGLILWAGYWAFKRDIDGLSKHFSEMGIKGFKVDFMNRDDQPIVDFYTKCAQATAKYNMLIDFHGAYKPSGLNRTYPNVINFEGVNGLEQMKWNKTTNQVEYDVTIPFIRMVAGPMDYTQGAMKNANRNNYAAVYTEPMSMGTRCRQLAEYVIFDAPLNMLCDSPSNYKQEPECTEFISGIPTTWDETIALDGKIGDYVVMARRKGDKWYVGALTDWDARDMEIDLSFLPEGEYTVIIYKDGINADKAARDYRKLEEQLNSPKSINIHMAPGGGWVAEFTKK